MDTRELLNYAIKVFGKEKSISWGMLADRADVTHIRLLTGMYEKDLGILDRAQSYVEEQLHKLLVASFQGTGSVADFEGMAFHAGSVLLAAQNVAELVKMNCFGFSNASDTDINKLEFYPWMVNGGLGNIERGKPVIAFVGDNFLPGWVAVNYLKEKGLTEQIEICGIGPAGDDISRFYDRCRVIAAMTKASKAIRSGFADVIVASSSCISFDILSDAKKAESRLIWISKERNVGLPDRTDDPVDKIVEDLIAGAEGAWIRDCEKAGEVAVKAAQGIKRKPISQYLLSEDEAKAEAKKCREDCDLCFNSCPNSLMLGKAVRKIERDGLAALTEIEKGCYLCGKCEEACPENIRLLDMIIASQGKRQAEDKFVMRAGRGPACREEAMGGAWGLANAAGWFHVFGCGDAKTVEDIGWIVNEMLIHNCLVHIGGCAASEIARYFNKERGKYIFEEYGSDVAAKNLVNHGGCSACAHILNQQMNWSRTGPAISGYANYAPIADCGHNLVSQPLLVWGALPERMQAIVAAWARAGQAVVVGPASAFGWKRFLVGNKWDPERWWSYIMMAGGGAGDYAHMAPDEKRYHEPTPKNIIIPVETKEEALTAILIMSNRPCAVYDFRVINLEVYMKEHYDAFGEYPDDDWPFLIRTGLECPQRYKTLMLKELREKHGWEVERMTVKKARMPDGRLVDMKEYYDKYVIAKYFPTKFLRGMAKPMYFRTGGKKPEKKA
jgi:acetyl-CoA decarbonylase/synthase complex subunit alpha